LLAVDLGWWIEGILRTGDLEHGLISISTRRQLVDLPDEVATRVVISHYSDAKDALINELGLN
jgi:hypothetical protein